MKPEDAVSLARVVIDKYGADADKPSVHLAKALLDGAHTRDHLRARIERLERALEKTCSAMETRAWRTTTDATATADIAADLRAALAGTEPSP